MINVHVTPFMLVRMRMRIIYSRSISQNPKRNSVSVLSKNVGEGRYPKVRQKKYDYVIMIT